MDNKTAKERYDRIPEHGWDAAVDIRRGHRWLRDEGHKIKFVPVGVQTATELAQGKKPPTKEDADQSYRADLAPYVIQLRRYGIRPRTVAQLLKDHFNEQIKAGWFDVKFLKGAIESIYIHNEGAPGFESFAGERVPDDMSFKRAVATGKPINTPENIAIAFVRLGISLRYDSFSDTYLIDGLPGFGPFLDDAAIQRIRFIISRQYEFLPERQMMFDYCHDYARYYGFDPACDYFDKVESKYDGKPRLDRFLIDYAGAKDTPYVRAVSELMFLAVVRRNRHPGAKFDEMVVLESPQGKDKSSALQVMALNDNWFGDSFPMDADNRETMEHAKGKLIIEVAELQGISKAAVEHVKAMLSRRSDEGRLAYAKSHTKQPRRFIFVGTSNGKSYLQDASGNRRFWPVAIEAFDLPKVRRDIHQLWGEAAQRESLGFSIRLEPKLYDDAGIEQDARLAANDDPFTHAFRDQLGDKVGRITNEDAWALLGYVDAARRTPELQRRYSAALKSLGWRPMTIQIEPGKGGRTARGYGIGTDTRRVIVDRDHNRRPYAIYDQGLTPDNDQEADAQADFG